MMPHQARQYTRGLQYGTYRALTGMTLIELLVVMAIISVLAAVVMPVFRYARGFAQRSVCVSNMHQCSLAFTLYSQDYDDNLPSFRADADSAIQPANMVYWHDHFCRATRLEPNEVSWASLLVPYVNNSDRSSAQKSAVFRCPADSDLVARPVTSYEYKMLLADQPMVSQLPAPSETALLWEQWAYHVDSNLSEYDRRAAMNVIFVDGHAHWTRLADTTTARFGSGPDLHWFFTGNGDSLDYYGNDVVVP